LYKKAAERAIIPQVFFQLGLAYLKKGMNNEAVDVYKKLIEIAPDYEEAHLNLGLAYGGLKRWNEAIQSFFRELSFHPENYYAYIYLGFVYKELGDYKKAISYFKKAYSKPGVPDPEGLFKVISDLESRIESKVGH
ncbi:MAG: tetratricopeptide repeat protein, partial [Desulfobacterota bacterium]|nr:tetratricopeptide repeat protein [Thermodesulfobacteriota bacterium]